MTAVMAVKAMASSACCERCRSEGGNASTLEDAKLAVIRFLAEGGARVRSRADYSLSQLFTQAYTPATWALSAGPAPGFYIIS